MAVLTTDARNALPDSAFACIEGSGDSKTRLYPHHHADGSLDLPHLRNALSRVAQEATTSCGADHLRAHAKAAGIGEKEMAMADAPVEVKSFAPVDLDLKDTGEIVVAFARINEIDREKDVTYPGAFPSKTVPMSAYSHNSWPQRGGMLPPGKGVIGEDGDLAVFRGKFFMNTTHGRDTYETVKEMGDEQEWSYGYAVLDFIPKPKEFPGARRGLKSLDVREVAPVLIGAGASTRTLGIKGLEDDDLLVGSFAEQADRVLAALKELHVREEEIVDLRLKEGRAISTDRRNRLAQQRDLLRELLAGVENLLTETEPKPKDAAEGKALGSLLTARATLAAEMAARGYHI